VVTTGTQWGVAERFVSGVAPSATNPSVDVQSVPVVPLIQTTKMQETVTKKTLFLTLLGYVGVPCKGLGRTRDAPSARLRATNSGMLHTWRNSTRLCSMPIRLG
jgi:hypothetical protein